MNPSTLPRALFAGLCAFLLCASAQPAAAQGDARARQDAAVRINQIQVIGTHNSYHAGFAPSEAKLIQARNPKAFEALDYAHPPIDQQLSAGVRQIEIDIYADAKGGRFAHPAITGWTAAAGMPADPPIDPGHLLEQPGFKVLHVAGIDERSTCLTFVACLTVVHRWTAAHPTALPIFILVETKQDRSAAADKPAPPPYAGAIPTEPFTAAAFDAVDAEILSVFKRAEIITPDLVRGAYKTLPDAIAHDGWPTLAAARGKVVFLMDQANVTATYVENHPGLQGRVIFTNSTAGAPDAAFIEQNGGSPAEINALVEQGYLVRTRTDEPTGDARANNTARRDLVLPSGAQMLSTDYPQSEPARFPGHYAVALPGNAVARCNPVLKAAGCVDALLEPR